MLWIFVSLSGYFMNALAAVFDKFLLSENRIGSPVLYAFYTSLISSFALVLVPFGFVYFIPDAAFLALFAGFLFLMGLLAFYMAVKESEVSRVAPLVGVSTVGFIFLVSLLFQLTSGTFFDLQDLLALLLLVGGGYLLATRSSGVPCISCARSILLAGALMASSLLLLKQSYDLSNFASGLVWSRMGMFVTGLGFLLIPAFRSDILARIERGYNTRKRAVSTGSYFLLNKVFGGMGAFLISYALSLGPVTFVQGLNGMQFAFLFLIVVPLSYRFPHIFNEKWGKREWFRKIYALSLLILGVFLAAMGGNLKGFL